MNEPIRISAVSPLEWPGLLAAFDERTVYHALPWLHLLQETYDLELVLLKAESAGQCIGVWPYLRLRKGCFTIHGSPLPGWGTAYLGPLVAKGCDATRVVAAFLEEGGVGKASFVALRLYGECRKIDLSLFKHRLVERFETYMLSLVQSEEDLWNRLESRCRNNIRRATKNGVMIQREEGPEFLDDYWDMTVDVFERQGLRPNVPRLFIDNLWKFLAPAGQVAALSAVHDGKRIAAVILPHDDRQMLYWGGASFASQRKLVPNNLLLWKGILAGKQLGLRSFDFISAAGNPGRFKRAFGPDLIEIATHWEYTSSFLVRTLKNLYERWARP